MCISRLLDTYRKIHKLCDVLSYFTNKVFKFSNNNVKVSYEGKFEVELEELRMVVKRDENAQ